VHLKKNNILSFLRLEDRISAFVDVDIQKNRQNFMDRETNKHRGARETRNEGRVFEGNKNQTFKILWTYKKT